MDNQTRAFLGETYDWLKASIQLEDVQPLYGGVRVYLPRWTASQMFITQLRSGEQETKYRIPLGWHEKETLCQLFIEQDFLAIQPEERSGIPDEAHPNITLTNSKGESHSVAKWSGVVDVHFDVLYQALLALAERTQNHKPIPDRFSTWQKGALMGGLGLLLSLFLLLSYGLAAILTTVWWTEKTMLLFMLLFVLLVGTPVALRGLTWRERNKSPEDRLFSNPPVNFILGLLFSMAFICCTNMVWAILQEWRHGKHMATIGNVEFSVLISYTALFTLHLVMLGTMLFGPRLLELIDERF